MPTRGSFTKVTARLSAQLGAPCRCLGTGSQVNAGTWALHPMCRLYTNVSEWWRWSVTFLAPGHVGPPLPCNDIKLVDVADMNYFAANGEGEVSLLHSVRCLCTDSSGKICWFAEYSILHFIKIPTRYLIISFCSDKDKQWIYGDKDTYSLIRPIPHSKTHPCLRFISKKCICL